ncbi:MAG: hypothetical protein ACK4ND_01890 [Cytophagaceae bacterium]
MTKGIITLMLMIIALGACNSFMKKEIKVYIEVGKYGWYFVFIENVDKEISAEEPIALDLTDENFAIVKLGNPAKYKLRIYDKDSNKELSQDMKMISYSGNYEAFMSCKFYYPNPEKYPDDIFRTDVNDPRSYIRKDINRRGSEMLDSIMKQHDLHW